MSSLQDPKTPSPRDTSPPPYEEGFVVPAEEQYSTESHDFADYTKVSMHHPYNNVEYSGEMRPLIAAAYHNRTKNPLCRLPDGVLVRLMRLLDPVSIECLRRCSRIFLRLFPAACASADDFSTTADPRFPWPTSMLKLQPAEKAGFLSLMARDWYCHDCLAARQAPNWQERFRAATKVYMHCAGCRADHPACLFSRKQRRSQPSSRICIGHEGHLRLCEHETASWKDVLSIAGRLGQWLARNPTESGGGRIELKRWLKRNLYLGCSRRFDPLGGLGLRSLSAALARRQLCCPPYPILCVSFRMSEDDRGRFSLVRYWSAHQPMNLTPNQCFKPDELARGLAQLREREAHYICPQVEPGRLPGAALFDPNYCDHLEYDGRESTAWDRPPPAEASPCPHESKMPFGQINWQKLRDKSCSGGFAHGGPRCFIDAPGPDASSLQRVSTELQGCSDTENCVRVAHESGIYLEREEHGLLPKMNTGWYSILDPGSYDLKDDVEGFGVYWCKSKDCKNYYRFNRSRLRPLLRDHRHPCPH